MIRASLISLVLLTGALAACTTKDDDSSTTTGSGTGAGAGQSGYGSGNGAITSGPVGGIEAQRQELTVQVGDTIHFGYDSSDVTGENQQILQRQASYMQKYPNLAFTIEGHCDDRGTREYNLALGERRANAAKNALVTLGVSGQRLQTISYGKERPIAAGSDEAAWAQDRRAVTVIN